MVLRPVTAADEEFLLSVYASTRSDELAQAPWSDEQKGQFLKWQFDLQRREYDARFPDAEYFVIMIDDWMNQSVQPRPCATWSLC